MPAQSCQQQQQEELTSILAIYGEDCRVLSKDGEGPAEETHAIEILIPGAAAEPHIRLTAHLPPGYPASCAPVMELCAPHVPADALAAAVSKMDASFTPGEVVLFEWVQVLTDLHVGWQEAQEAGLQAALQATSLLDDVEATHSDRHREGPPRVAPAAKDADPASASFVGPGHLTSDEAELMAAVAPTIISGEPCTERKSTFQAHVAPVSSAAEVRAVMAVLMQNNKVRHATHNIMAFRIQLPNGQWLRDYDDDGEDAAGGRLLHLLQVANISGVVVVVSRWFGGVLLGPARFTHINNTARHLLLKTGYLVAPGSSSGGAKKGKR